MPTNYQKPKEFIAQSNTILAMQYKNNNLPSIKHFIRQYNFELKRKPREYEWFIVVNGKVFSCLSSTFTLVGEICGFKPRGNNNNINQQEEK